jgi:endonuclease/exonuclease/phosphatase family metal-dependent hydrolase
MREREHGFEFLFVVNHLWRSDEPARHEQAALLNDWGRDQSEPILMVGDYNFDWEVDGGGHDLGYDNLTADGVFDWVEPDPIVKTQCSGYYDSILDFTFLGGDARSWGATSEVLRTDHDYCREDPENYSDHRPVAVTFTVPE